MLAHHAARGRRDLVLHLHRFHDHDRRAAPHLVALADQDADDGALERRPHRDRPRRRAGCLPFGPRSGGGRRGATVVEDRERIARIDADAGEIGRGVRPIAASIGVAVPLEEQRAMPLAGRELGEVVVDQPGVELAPHHPRMARDGAQEVEIGVDAVDAKRAQRGVGLGESGFVAGRRAHHQLCQQRVEPAARRVAGVPRAVDANAAAARRLVHREGPAGWHRAAVGGHALHVDAQLDGAASRARHVVLP